MKGIDKLTENVIKDLLTENPEWVTINYDKFSFGDSEARAFAWYKGKLYVGENSTDWHYSLVPRDVKKKKADKDYDYISRKKLEYPGRLWLKEKIMSFWKYPPESKWKKLMKELGSHSNINTNLLSKSWRVEIVPNKNGKPIKVRDTDWNDRVSVLIPTLKYGGSDERTAKELALIHVLSPQDIRKKNKKVYQKNIKNLPDGMSTAEYKAIISKYQFTEGWGWEKKQLNETPDGISSDALSTLCSYNDHDAFAFGWFNNKFFHSENGQTHYSIWENEDDRYPILRDKLKYKGRLWENKKIVSFWEYPPQSKFRKLAKDIKDDTGIDILGNGWRIEVVMNSKGKFEDPGDNWENDSRNQGVLVPTKDYAGSIKRTEDELNKIWHIMTNDDPRRKNRKVYQKNIDLPDGMSTAEYKALTSKYQFTEGWSWEKELAMENKIEKNINSYLFKDESIVKLKEFTESLDKDWLLTEMTASPVNSTDADDGPATWYVNYRHYSKDVKKLAEKAGMKIINYLVNGVNEDYSNADDYGDAIAVSFFPAGVAGASTPTNYRDWKGTKAYNEWRKWITKVAIQLGFKFAQHVDKEEKKRAIDTAKDITGTEELSQNTYHTVPLKERVVNDLLKIEKDILRGL